MARSVRHCIVLHGLFYARSIGNQSPLVPGRPSMIGRATHTAVWSKSHPGFVSCFFLFPFSFSSLSQKNTSQSCSMRIRPVVERIPFKTAFFWALLRCHHALPSWRLSLQAYRIRNWPFSISDWHCRCRLRNRCAGSVLLQYDMRADYATGTEQRAPQLPGPGPNRRRHMSNPPLAGLGRRPSWLAELLTDETLYAQFRGDTVPGHTQVPRASSFTSALFRGRLSGFLHHISHLLGWASRLDFQGK